MIKICPGTGKISYDSEEDAEDAIPRLEKKYGKAGTPYYCFACSKWHLGTLDKSNKKKKQNETKRKRT